MITLGALGGLGTPEILVILLLIVLIGFGIVSPILWLQERKRRKYWQAKAEGYEKHLLNKR